MKRAFLAAIRFTDRHVIWLSILFIIGIYGLFLGAGVMSANAERRQLETHMHALSTAPDLRQVAAECLTLLQLDNLPKGPDHLVYEVNQPEDNRLPPAIRAKHPRWVLVDPANSTVNIVFGRYGYLFKRRGDDPHEAWELYLFGEDPADCRELLLL